MDVIVSVLGTGILTGSWAKYTLEDGTSLCATTPIAPILAHVVMNETANSHEPPYLVLVVPHSLITENLAWDVLERDGGGINVTRLSREMDRLCKKIIEAFVEDNGSAILDWEHGELDASLRDRLLSAFATYSSCARENMEDCRIKLASVQAIGSFPLLREEGTTTNERAYAYLTFRGSVLDPFVKVYTALKEITRGGGKGEMTIHFDVSSGMNIVTVSALLGAKAFTMVHDAELKVYNSDPFKREITDRCGREKWGQNVELIPGSRVPLGVTGVDELMLTFRLMEDIISLLGKGWWALDPEEKERILEDVRDELGSLYGGTEDSGVDEIVERIRKLLIALRRISCGLSETLVPYVHSGLKDLDELKGEVYGDGGPYKRIRETLRGEIRGISSGSCGVQVSADGTVLHYNRVTGPTFVLLDAVSYVLSRFYSKRGFPGKDFGFEARGPFDSAVLGGRGELTPGFLAGLMTFYFWERMYTNLAFILKELDFNEEKTRKLYDLLEGGINIPDSGEYSEMVDLVREKFEEYVEKKFLRSKDGGMSLSEFMDRRENCLKSNLKVSALRSQYSGGDLGLYRLYYISKALYDLRRNLETDEGRGLLDIILNAEVKPDLGGARLGVLLEELLANFMGRSDCRGFTSWVGDVRNAGELIQMHLSRDDKYENLIKLINWKRFDTFLKALAIRWNEDAPKLVGKSDIVALLRNLVAHIGLTNFTVTDITLIPRRRVDGSNQDKAEVVVFYDEALFRKLEHLSEIGGQGSLCDVR